MPDFTKIPCYRIDLVNLNRAFELCSLLKNSNIESYVYSFINKYMTPEEAVMKYGVQYNIKASEHGERVYSQAFQIPGWSTKPSPKSSGRDMLDILVHFPNINKNDVTLLIWDMTLYPRQTIDPKYEINQVERLFIKEHIKKFGVKPAGNIKDERHMDGKSVVLKSTLNRLFGVEA